LNTVGFLTCAHLLPVHDEQNGREEERNAVEEAKLENEKDNIYSYAAMVIFSIFVLSYGIAETYKNWKITKDIVIVEE